MATCSRLHVQPDPRQPLQSELGGGSRSPAAGGHDRWLPVQLDLACFDVAAQPTNVDLWRLLRLELEGDERLQSELKCEVRPQAQPELVWRHAAGHHAAIDLWPQGLEGGTLPSRHADGHEVVAKQLLDHGADVAAASHDVVAALMAAATGGREAVAKRLLDHGSDVTAARHKGATTLRTAAQGDHEAVAKPYWTMVPIWPLQNTRVRVR